MTPLGRALAERIRRDGPLSVAEYMALCLGDPQHGYYRRADAIGRSGDFITAPEISQIFGELIGLWAATVWTAIGQPVPLRLVELGPGRGTLMAAALRAITKTVPALRAAIDLHLVEINARLRERQAAALAAARPCWHDSPAPIPDGWHERSVGLEGDRLIYATGALVSNPPLEPAHAQAPLGATVEISQASRDLVAMVAARIAAQGGAALFIDYGAPASGTGDTLQAVREHQKVDPLELPGESDLTAHVDFAAAARAARAVGAAVHGPVPQGLFLSRLGIAARAAILLRNAAPAQRRDIETACERLIGEAQMGSLFQVLAITAPRAPTPPGFPSQPS